MIKYLRDDILKLKAYEVEKSDDMIKLDAMESPFLLEDDLLNKWLAHIKTSKLNYYPTANNELKQIIKDLMQIDDDLDIMFGNGSDELIQIIMLGLKKNTEIIGFKPSFVMYEMVANWCNLAFKFINLTSNFDINLNEVLATIDNDKPQVIFVAYPNNPTGNCFNKNAIFNILQTNTLVIIDEAYYAYTDNSFIDQIKHYENLIVLRTVSKIGFAGLRLGILIAKEEVVAQLNKIRMPYNVSSLNMLSAQLLLSEKDYITRNTSIIKKNRTIMLETLSSIKNIKVYHSDANFIFFTATQAELLFQFLLSNNIKIKNLNNVIAGALRVTVSIAEDNELFINTVKKFYDKNNTN